MARRVRRLGTPSRAGSTTSVLRRPDLRLVLVLTVPTRPAQEAGCASGSHQRAISATTSSSKKLWHALRLFATILMPETWADVGVWPLGITVRAGRKRAGLRRTTVGKRRQTSSSVPKEPPGTTRSRVGHTISAWPRSGRPLVSHPLQSPVPLSQPARFFWACASFTSIGWGLTSGIRRPRGALPACFKQRRWRLRRKPIDRKLLREFLPSLW